jgi:anaerobic magnesium-protoporphyrin IX monomethyl ester cyclase
MRLAFIYPPYGGVRNQPSIETVTRNYGIYPPINLAYVSAIARHSGHDVSFMDANAECLSKEDVLKRVRKSGAEVLLFTVTTYLFHQTLDWIRYLKKNTGCKIIVGGVHAKIYPKETMSHRSIDYVVAGDCENALPNLLAALQSKPSPARLKRVPNICFRDSGQVVQTGPGECCGFLKGVYPARDLLPNSMYYSFISQRKNYTGILSSRGCPFRCNYCEQGHQTHNSVREAHDFIREIEQCYHEHGIREFDFFDPIFTMNKKRAIALCDAIKRLGLDIQYAIRTRPDCVDEEIIIALKKSGCKRIYYGIESSDQEILKKINKKSDLAVIEKVVRLTNKHGINTFGFFMFGCPGETLETIRRTAEYSRKLKLDYVQYNNFVALAGTEIYRQLMSETGKDFWSEYTLQEKEPGWRIPRIGTTLTDSQIELEIIRAYRRFYFRPVQVAKKIIAVKSVGELMRYVRAGIDILRS